MQNIIHKNIISILKNTPKNKLPLNDLINLLNEKRTILKSIIIKNIIQLLNI